MEKEDYKIIAQVSCVIFFCYIMVSLSLLLGGGFNSITGFSVSEGGVSYVDCVGLTNNDTNNTNSSVECSDLMDNNVITGFSVGEPDLFDWASLNTILFVLFGIIMVVSIVINFSVYHWKNNLEKEVDSKTSELDDSNMALENAKQELSLEIEHLKKFNKLVVGRELKMVELKKRIRELENKSGGKRR